MNKMFFICLPIFCWLTVFMARYSPDDVELIIKSNAAVFPVIISFGWCSLLTLLLFYTIFNFAKMLRCVFAS